MMYVLLVYIRRYLIFHSYFHLKFTYTQKHCPLAQAEARRRMDRTRGPDYASAAAPPAPVSNAAARQLRSNRTLAEAFSRGDDLCDTDEDTPPPPTNQRTGKSSEEEKEKEQVDEDCQICCAIVESELDQQAWGSLGGKKPAVLKGKKSMQKKKPPSRRPRKSGLPDCSNEGCTRVAHRHGLCTPCANGGTECSNEGCTRAARSRGMCQPCASGGNECSNEGCTRAARCRRGLCQPCASDGGSKKCSVPGCTSIASVGKKCSLHRYPCSIPGCNRRGDIVTDNGSRFCHDHARAEASDEHRRALGIRNNRCAERYRTDPKYRTALLLRNRLNKAMNTAGTSYQGKLNLLSCTVDQLDRYLEQFFREPGNEWMNWSNQGRPEFGRPGWELDHVYPLAKLDLTDPEQLSRANHWSNFQPLSAQDNRSKGSTPPVGFSWNIERGRWMWNEASGRTNYDLPTASAGDVTTIDDLLEEFDDDESDEFDGSGDDDNE